MVLGSYYGQPTQRSKGDRRRVTFLCDRRLYDQVKEDAEFRGMTIGAWLEAAIADRIHILSKLPKLEEMMEHKLLEILMYRNAARRDKGNNGEDA